ncbi:uncharacterized protein G2W53_041537 [Senna tora]|uniref:Transmembrane protein n=1 Tax=Senna tora TaxID=362788 RepID=A0A834SF80_9FABA|nr:uncharacterized protein G2W53_041537 [Senna tora]
MPCFVRSGRDLQALKARILCTWGMVFVYAFAQYWHSLNGHGALGSSPIRVIFFIALDVISSFVERVCRCATLERKGLPNGEGILRPSPLRDFSSLPSAEGSFILHLSGGVFLPSLWRDCLSVPSVEGSFGHSFGGIIHPSFRRKYLQIALLQKDFRLVDSQRRFRSVASSVFLLSMPLQRGRSAYQLFSCVLQQRPFRGVNPLVIFLAMFSSNALQRG